MNLISRNGIRIGGAPGSLGSRRRFLTVVISQQKEGIVEMSKTEQELEELEDQGKTCADCEHYDICGLPKEPICFGFVSPKAQQK